MCSWPLNFSRRNKRRLKMGPSVRRDCYDSSMLCLRTGEASWFLGGAEFGRAERHASLAQLLPGMRPGV